MATPNVGILTTSGKALIDKVNSGQAKISFSKVVFSSMDNSQLSDTQVKALTAISPQEVVVSPPETTLDTTSGETRIRATGTNEQLANGVYVKTYGVFAKDDTGNEVLYGVTVSPNPNYFPAYDGVTPQAVTYSYKVNISNTSNITFTNSNDIYVSETDLAEAVQPYAKTVDVNQQLDKKVNIADMRKPASNVAGIDEVVKDNGDGSINFSGINVPFKGTVTGDFHNYNQTGLYSYNTGNDAIANSIGAAPDGVLIVIAQSNGNVYHYLMSSYSERYFEICMGGSWYDWQKQLFEDDLNNGLATKQDKLAYTPADDSKVAHLSGANNFDTVPTVNNNPLLLTSSLPSDLARTGQDANFTGKLQKSGKDVATTDDVTTAVSTATANMLDSMPPSLTIADDGTYTITAPATTSTPIVKYFLHYNVDGQSNVTKLDVGTKLTGSLKELITKPDKTTTYDVQATAMHTNTESGVSNSVQFTYVPIDENIYGASWDRKSSPTLTRTDAAVGLKAGINGAQNDFDNAGPWKGMHRVTDSMNNVFVRVPKFYIRKTQTGDSDNGTATWQVSLVSHGDDWYMPKGFWDFTNSKELDYIDIGAYDATGSSSKLTSVAGQAPLVNLSIVDFRNAAKSNGTGYQLWDIHANDMLQVLFIIEFATLNSQSIMEGVDNGSSAAGSGATDSHKGSSGTAGSGSNAMSYRGIENLYGNVWQFCDGVNFKDNQPWVCEDATKYQSDLFTAPYAHTSYAATSSDSNYCIKAMWVDSVHRYAQFATDDSGSGSTYYADCDYPGSGNTALETGGDWGNGTGGGLFGSNRAVSSAFVAANFGCRLLKKALL